MGVVLILSPHLDDAVLSCPAYIQRSVAAGDDVRIATVFTEAASGAAALYRKRRSEDRKAARELGAHTVHLGFRDAPFRSRQYGSFRGIVFGRAAEYQATCRQVTQEIAKLVARLHPAEVLAPMAAGNHVDHRLVRDAALRLWPTVPLRFYEDRPYAFVREQVGHVLGRPLAGRPERLWRRYFSATYVRRYLGSDDPSLVRAAWSNAPHFPAEFRLTAMRQPDPNSMELRRTLTVLQHYESQCEDLFAGTEEMKRLYQSRPETLYRVSRVTQD